MTANPANWFRGFGGEGKFKNITNITNFGAFIKLTSGDEGLIHISEIANEYVSDINNFVQVGDLVKVKVIGINDKSKLELSLKQCNESDVVEKKEEVKEEPAPKVSPKKNKDNKFEDKLVNFLKKSEEKQIDIRRNLKQKQGIAKKRR